MKEAGPFGPASHPSRFCPPFAWQIGTDGSRHGSTRGRSPLEQRLPPGKWRPRTSLDCFNGVDQPFSAEEVPPVPVVIAECNTLGTFGPHKRRPGRGRGSIRPLRILIGCDNTSVHTRYYGRRTRIFPTILGNLWLEIAQWDARDGLSPAVIVPGAKDAPPCDHRRAWPLTVQPASQVQTAWLRSGTTPRGIQS